MAGPCTICRGCTRCHLAYHGLPPCVRNHLIPCLVSNLFLTLDHWHDVLVGSLLGTFVSYFTYRQYYPSLSSELSHRPYSPRVKREDILPLHHHQASVDHHDDTYPQPPPQGYHSPFSQVPAPLAHQSLPHDRPSEDYELEGTVKRPDVGPLEEVWKDGEHDFSQPRTAPPAQTRVQDASSRQ